MFYLYYYTPPGLIMKIFVKLRVEELFSSTFNRLEQLKGGPLILGLKEHFYNTFNIIKKF